MLQGFGDVPFVASQNGLERHEVEPQHLLMNSVKRSMPDTLRGGLFEGSRLWREDIRKDFEETSSQLVHVLIRFRSLAMLQVANCNLIS